MLRGEVLDFHGGLSDLSARILRAVGSPEERFREDPARILRLVRLCATLEGFRPEVATAREARRLAPELLPSLPGERLSGELLKALAASPGKTCSLLARLGILAPLLPSLRGREREAARTLSPRLSRLVRTGGIPPPRSLLTASLLLLLPPGERECAGRRLALPEIRESLRLCADAEVLSRPPEGEEHPLASTEGILLRHGDPGRLVLLLSVLGAGWSRSARMASRVLSLSRSAPPLVGGRDLARMGVPPGERMGRILSAVREEELAGALRGRREALERAKALAEGKE
jgi:hypothetical protein